MQTQPDSIDGPFDPPLDEGIADIVLTLRAGGIDTYESCQGGEGHAYPEPTVRFHGDQGEGWRALAVALHAGLPVLTLARLWHIIDGEPNGAYWQMTFGARAAVVSLAAVEYEDDDAQP